MIVECGNVWTEPLLAERKLLSVEKRKNSVKIHRRLPAEGELMVYFFFF